MSLLLLLKTTSGAAVITTPSDGPLANAGGGHARDEFETMTAFRQMIIDSYQRETVAPPRERRPPPWRKSVRGQ